MLRFLSCDLKFSQEGALKFQGLVEFVVSHLVASSAIFSEPLAQRKTTGARSVIFGYCSNATNARLEVTHAFRSRDFQDIVCEELRRSVQAASSYRRKASRHFFLRCAGIFSC